MDDQDARTRLDEERARLEGIREPLATALAESESESTGEHPLEQHPADQGTETSDREQDLSLLEQVEAELADVEHALARLDDGTYGQCEACGKPIGDDRLAVVPGARFCVDDQAAAEREARSHTIN